MKPQTVRGLLAGVFIFFLFFFIVPLLGLYGSAVSLYGAGAWRKAAALLADGGTWRVVAFSSVQAAVSAFLCLAIALPGAMLSARYEFRGKRFLRSASLVPFVLPSIVVVIAMIAFYGKSGMLNDLLGTELNLVYNPLGIVLAHVFYNVSLALRILSDGMERIDPRLKETAASLGLGRTAVFFRVTLPLAAPSLVTAFSIVFLYCFMSFGVVLVFGGVRYATLEVEIYRAMFAKLDLLSAAAYSVLQIALAAAFFGTAGFLARKLGSRSAKPPRRDLVPLASESRPKRTFVLAYLAFFCILLFGPLVSLAYRAFTPNGVFTLSAFAELFGRGTSGRDAADIIRSSVPAVAVRSLAFATASGSLAFILSLGTALALRSKPKSWEAYFLLPAGMSFVTLGIGLGLVYGEVLPPAPLTVAAQVFLSFPFVYRILKETLAGFHPNYAEAGRSLGRKGFALFRDVQFPIMKRGLLNALAFGVAVSFADFTAVLTVGRGEIATFPVAIYRLIGFRSYDLGLALGMIYILVCLGVFLWIDATSLRGDGGRP